MAVLLKGINLLDGTKSSGKTEQERKRNEIGKTLASSLAKKGGYGIIFTDGTTSDDYGSSGSSGSGSSGDSGEEVLLVLIPLHHQKNQKVQCLKVKDKSFTK